MRRMMSFVSLFIMMVGISSVLLFASPSNKVAEAEEGCHTVHVPGTNKDGPDSAQITDEGDTFTYDLYFRWNLYTWYGTDGISPSDALSQSNGLSVITAIFGWNEAEQDWLGFFPNAMSIPGANDLLALEHGEAYWFATDRAACTQWTVASDLTPEPTATETESPTETETATGTSTEEPTGTAVPTETETPGSNPTATSTVVPTKSPTATQTVTPTQTTVPTRTETPTQTEVPTVTATQTATPTATPTRSPTPTTTPTQTTVPTATSTPTSTPTLQCIGGSSYTVSSGSTSGPRITNVYVSHRRPCQGDTVTIRVTVDPATPANRMYFQFAIANGLNDTALTCMAKNYFPTPSSGNTWEVQVQYPYETTDGFGYRIVASDEEGDVSYVELATVNGSYFADCPTPAP